MITIILRKIILFLFFLLILFFNSDIYSETISIRGNFHYLYMKMDEYNKFARHYFQPLELNDFHKGFGETFEIRFDIWNKFRVGVESGIIQGNVKNKKDVFISSLLNSIYHNTISLLAIPTSFNFYYYFFNKGNSKTYCGGSLSIYHSILKIDVLSDNTIENKINFVHERVELKSNNFGFDFQLGREYVIFKKMGVDLKISYRFAKLNGFKGKRDYEIKYTDPNTNSIKSMTGSNDQDLVFIPSENYWGIDRSLYQVNGQKGSVNLGNWGISVGLVWYIK